MICNTQYNDRLSINFEEIIKIYHHHHQVYHFFICASICGIQRSRTLRLITPTRFRAMRWGEKKIALDRVFFLRAQCRIHWTRSPDENGNKKYRSRGSIYRLPHADVIHALFARQVVVPSNWWSKYPVMGNNLSNRHILRNNLVNENMVGHGSLWIWM